MSDIVTERFSSALAYAAEVHRDDVRKGDAASPYVGHLLAVCSLVLAHGGTEEQAIAALLHDTAEDHGGEARLDDVASRFGPAVAELVRDLSDSLVDVEALDKAPWWQRKVQYIAHVEGLAGSGSPALLVSVADKLDNVRATLEDYRAAEDPASFWLMFNDQSRGRIGQLWYYERLQEVFESAFAEAAPLARRLAEELGRTISELTELVAEREPKTSRRTDRELALSVEDGLRSSMQLPARLGQPGGDTAGQ